jgi:hypothetical protein
MKSKYCFKLDSDSVKIFKLSKSGMSNHMVRWSDYV